MIHCFSLLTFILIIIVCNRRVVWGVWDNYLGKGNLWSAALSHVIGILGLLFLGCLSCITGTYMNRKVGMSPYSFANFGLIHFLSCMQLLPLR